MVMFTSGDIFKAKAAELLDEIQEVKKTNEILFLIKYELQNKQVR